MMKAGGRQSDSCELDVSGFGGGALRTAAPYQLKSIPRFNEFA
jgi:hypothetical protein